MVDMATAKQQVDQAKQQIEKQRRIAEEQRRRLEEARKKLPNVTSQKALRQNNGLNGLRQRQQVIRAGKDISENIRKVNDYSRELSNYEKDVINQEQEIKRAEESSELRRSQFEAAYKAYTNQGSGSVLSGIPEDIKRMARAEADKAEESKVSLSKAYSKINASDGIYNPETFVFTSSKGEQMSIAPTEVSDKVLKSSIIDYRIPKIDTSMMDMQTKTEFKEFQMLSKEINPTYLDNVTRLVTQKNLNSSNLSSINELNVSSGVSDRISNRSGKIQSVGNWIDTNIIDRFEEGLDKGNSKAKEISIGNNSIGFIEARPEQTGSISSLPQTITYDKSKATGVSLFDFGKGAFNAGIAVGDVAYKKVVNPAFDKTIKVRVVAGTGGKIDTGISIGSGLAYIRDIPSKIVDYAADKYFEITNKDYVYSPKYFGSAIGDIVKGRTSIREYISKPNPQVEYNLRESVVTKPSKTDKSSPNLLYGNNYFTKEQVKSGATFVADTGLYFIPVAGEVMLLGDVAKSSEGLKNIDKETNKILESEWKKYQGEPTQEGYEKLSKEEFYSEYRNDIKDQLKTNYLTTGTLSLGTLGIIGASKGYSFIKDTTKIRPVVRETRFIGEPKKEFVKVRQPVESSGDIKFKSTFIIAEQEPPVLRRIEETSKLRDFFGVKPKRTIIDINAPNPTISEPFGRLAVVDDKPMILRTSKLTKEGLGEPKFTFIDGVQNNINIEDISSLPKLDRYTFAETLSKGKSEGRAIKLEDINKFVSENEQIGLGTIYSVDVTKPVGKQTSLTRVTTISKEGKKINGFDTYDVIAGFKSNLKPTSRASGKVNLVRGKVIDLPMAETLSKSYAVGPANIEKTPLSVTFRPDQILSNKELKILSDFKKPKAPTPKTSAKAITKQSVEILPVSSSAYAGTGLYERTDEFAVISPINLGAIQSNSLQKNIKMDITNLSSETTSQLSNKNGFSLMTDLKLKPSQKENQVLKTNQKEVQPLRSRQNIKLDLGLKQESKQSQRTDLAAKQSSKNKKPEIKLKTGKGFILPEIKAQKGKKASESIFKAIANVFGKEKVIGKSATKEGAGKILKSFLGKELSASGSIEQGGKKIDVADLIGEEFRLSKRSSKVLVERREKRLRKGTTGKEVQYFRKRRSKKKSIFGL